MKERLPRTVLLMNLASIVERADEQVLPAVYLFISRSLNASLSQLGILTLCRALAQALSSPISGLLGDRHPRPKIIAAGCLLWGLMTSALGLCTSLSQAMLFCAANGIGLALVIPCVQSVVADHYGEEARGGAFGAMSFTSSLGGLAGGVFATNVGGMRPWGVEGWRFAFQLMAGVSVVTAFLVMWYAEDPRTTAGSAALANTKKNDSILINNMRVRDDIRTVLQIPSFQVVVLQGIAGMVPWNAMVLLTLWLQLSGFSNLHASLLMALFTLGCAVGSFLGGHIGDLAAKRSPKHGRILACQCSVAAGLPLSFLLLKGLPTIQQIGISGSEIISTQTHQETTSAVEPPFVITLAYAVVMLSMGLLIVWCGCNNAALLSELVPSHLRSTIFAFDRALEGSLAAASAPLVGYVAESIYGFDKTALESSTTTAAETSIIGVDGESNGILAKRLTNAGALGSALLLCLVVPWLVCLCCYTLLHWTYPKDIKTRHAASSTLESYPYSSNNTNKKLEYIEDEEQRRVLPVSDDVAVSGQGIKKRGGAADKV